MTLTLHEHPFASYGWKAPIALDERDVPFEPHVVVDESDRVRDVP
jgi:glutathione S-transferase